MKTCRECGTTKPLCEYYTHIGMRDSHLNKCKDCVRKRVTNHRQDNVERIRAYDRARGRTDRVRLRNAQYLTRAKATDPDGFRKRRREATIRWRADNPEKVRANNAVANALRNGQLVKEPCSVCGLEPAEAHHSDYSRPLDVTWLCAEHHAEYHVTAREKRRASA